MNRRSQRYDGVQALRFVAALLVVVTHSTFYAHERLDESLPIWSLGSIGVDIFFVISGFVMMVTVGGVLGIDDGWRYFVGRRVLRIVPMYWLATTLKLLTMLLLPAAVLHAELDPLKTLLSYLFLPSTNVDGKFEPLLGVGWTLLFEAFFYAVFATALFLKAPLLRFVGLILGLCFLASFFRSSSWPAATIYFSPLVIYFLIGMLIGYWVGRTSSVTMLIVGLAGLGLVTASTLLFDLQILPKARSISVVLLSSSIVLLFVSVEPWINGKLPSWILYMGEASYVLYLFHPLVSPIVPETFSFIGWHAPVISVAGSILAALIAAVVIHAFVEKPMTRWLRSRIPYSDRAGA